MNGRTGLTFMLEEEKQEEAFELCLEIADCHMEERHVK